MPESATLSAAIARRGDIATVTIDLHDVGAGESLSVIPGSGLRPLLERSSLPPGQGHFIAGEYGSQGGFRLGINTDREQPARVAFRVEDEDDAGVDCRILTPHGETRPAQFTVRIEGRADVQISVDIADDAAPTLHIIARNVGHMADTARLLIPLPATLDIDLPESTDVAHWRLDDRAIALELHLVAESAMEFFVPLRPSDKLYGDTVELATIMVSATSCGTYSMEPLSVRFAHDSTLCVECHFSSALDTELQAGNELQSGDLAEVRILVRNDGHSWSRPQSLAINLSDGLRLIDGTIRVDGRLQSSGNTVDLPSIRPYGQARIDAGLIATAPISDGTLCTCEVRLNDAVAAVDRVVMRSAPSFPARRNYVWRTGPGALRPGGTSSVQLTIANFGTDIANEPRLHLQCGKLVPTRFAQRDHDGDTLLISNGDASSRFIELPALQSGEERTFDLELQAPDTFPNGQPFPLSAVLRIADAEIALGTIVFCGYSAPQIAVEHTLTMVRSTPMRVGDERLCRLTLTNSGSDVAEDVRVDLHLPEGMRAIDVHGAGVAGDSILIGDIAAGASKDLTVLLRLERADVGNCVLYVVPTVRAPRARTVTLDPLVVETRNAGHLGDCSFHLSPSKNGYLGELVLANVGDGPVNDATVLANHGGHYVANTASCDDQSVDDLPGGRCPWSNGFVVPSIAAGARVRLRWELDAGVPTHDVTAVIGRPEQPDLHLSATLPLPQRQQRFRDRDDDEALVFYADGTVGVNGSERMLSTPRLPMLGAGSESASAASPTADSGVSPQPVVEADPVPSTNGAAAVEPSADAQDGSAASAAADPGFQPSTGAVEAPAEPPADVDGPGPASGTTTHDAFTEQFKAALRSLWDIVDDERVVEMFRNPDGTVWTQDDAGTSANDLHYEFDDTDAVNVITLVAHYLGLPCDKRNPSISGLLPNGVLFSGMLAPPAHPGAMFTIRKYANMEDAAAELAAMAARGDSAVVELAGESAGNETSQAAGHFDDGFDDIVAALHQRGEATYEQPLPQEPTTGNDSEEEPFVEITGPTGVASFDETKCFRLRAIVERMRNVSSLGWFRHVLAIRLLVPDQLLAADVDSNEEWERLAASLSKTLGATLASTVMPNFVPDLVWMSRLTDQPGLDAVTVILRNLPKAIAEAQTYRIEPWRNIECYVRPSMDLFEYVGKEDRGSLGHLNALLAYFIVDQGEDESLVSALRNYKAAASEAFQTFVYAGNETQLRRMGAAPNEQLDHLLDLVVEALP